MRFFLCLLTATAFLSSCLSASRQDGAGNVDSVATDTVISADTLTVKEAEEAMPARADELFLDFIFNFTSDVEVQRCRIYSPLPVDDNGQISNIRKSEWKYDPICFGSEVYSTLSAREEDMELEKDTSISAAHVDILDLGEKQAKRYLFKRYKEFGPWILYGIKKEPFSRETDPVDFLEFYERFATDSVFQREHVKEPLKFVTVDPDDDFSIIGCDIDADQWNAFKPELPLDALDNINLGQNLSEATSIYLSLRGPSNGFINTLIFKKHDGIWKLTQFEDTSE